MLEVIVAPAAQRDLSEIHDYIGARNAAAADRLLEHFDRLAELLRRNPYIGPMALRPRGSDLRKTSVAPYVVFYRVSENRIEVVRVLHASRDLDDPAHFRQSQEP